MPCDTAPATRRRSLCAHYADASRSAFVNPSIFASETARRVYSSSCLIEEFSLADPTSTISLSLVVCDSLHPVEDVANDGPARLTRRGILPEYPVLFRSVQRAVLPLQGVQGVDE